jgi:hypothetical protein
MKVKFIISPIGAFGLAYSEGMEADLNEGQAEQLIEAGYAICIDEEVKQTAVSKEVKETPEKPKKVK